MRVIALATAALAALALASTTAVADKFRPEVLQKTCTDMTFNQIGQKLAVLVEEYEFSSDPAMAEQEAVGLLCPAQVAGSQEGQVHQATTIVVPLSGLFGNSNNQQRHKRRPPPPPHYAGSHQQHHSQQLRIPRVSPPHVSGYTTRRSATAVTAVGTGAGYGYGRSRATESREPAFQRKATNYCKSQEEFGPAPSSSRDGIPYASCEWIDQIPGKPCGGYHCRTR